MQNITDLVKPRLVLADEKPDTFTGLTGFPIESALRKDANMEKLKVLSLRDLAIKHSPKARESRKAAAKYGKIWADMGLQSACLFGADSAKYDATAVEKAALELLQLTFLHPEAWPDDPHVLDDVKDAETIAIKAHSLGKAVEVQPQIETAMLDAARLLCELTGDALPPWVDAACAPAGTGGDEIPGKMPQTRIGKLAIEAAWQIECRTGKRATAKAVIEELQAWTETEPELTETIPHGVKWATTKGKQKPFDVEACAKALETWQASRA